METAMKDLEATRWARSRWSDFHLPKHRTTLLAVFKKFCRAETVPSWRDALIAVGCGGEIDYLPGEPGHPDFEHPPLRPDDVLVLG